MAKHRSRSDLVFLKTRSDLYLKLISLWLPPLLWMGVIFTLSSIPDLQATTDPFWNFITRKTAHILEYSILSFLISRAMGFKKPLLVIVLSVLYALSDEYHQTLVESRSGKLSDIIFDSIGVLLGFYVSRWKKLLTQPWKPKN